MIQNFTDQNFDSEVISFPGLVVVDFWAVWCGPCKTLAPIMEEIAKEMEQNTNIKFGKIDVDSSPNITQKLYITHMPTLKFFKNGQVVGELVAVRPKEVIVAKIKELVGT